MASITIKVDTTDFDAAIDHMIQRLEEVAAKAEEVGINLDGELVSEAERLVRLLNQAGEKS